MSSDIRIWLVDDDPEENGPLVVPADDFTAKLPGAFVYTEDGVDTYIPWHRIDRIEADPG